MVKFLYNDHIKRAPLSIQASYILILLYGAFFTIIPAAKIIIEIIEISTLKLFNCQLGGWDSKLPAQHIVCDNDSTLVFTISQWLIRTVSIFLIVIVDTLKQFLSSGLTVILLFVVILLVLRYHKVKTTKLKKSLWRIAFGVFCGLIIIFLGARVLARFQDYRKLLKLALPYEARKAIRELNVCKNPLPANFTKRSYPVELEFNEKDCTFANDFLKIKNIDYASCKKISAFTIIDKNNVYTHNYDRASGVSLVYRIENKADAKSLVYLGSNYYQDKYHLFYDSDGEFRIIEGIDLNSVKILSTHFIKDKNNVYFVRGYRKNPEKKTLENLDPQTLENVQNERNHERYFRDKNGIYFVQIKQDQILIQKIEEADKDSFQVLQQYGLAKDKNHVYHEGKTIKDLDAPSFELLNGGYSRDKYWIYTGVGNPNYFKIIEEADPCTFEVIDYRDNYEWAGYAKDKRHVYYRDTVVEGADPVTFQVEKLKDGSFRAYDKNYEYQGKFRKQDIPR